MILSNNMIFYILRSRQRHSLRQPSRPRGRPVASVRLRGAAVESDSQLRVCAQPGDAQGLHGRLRGHARRPRSLSWRRWQRMPVARIQRALALQAAHCGPPRPCWPGRAFSVHYRSNRDVCGTVLIHKHTLNMHTTLIQIHMVILTNRLYTARSRWRMARTTSSKVCPTDTCSFASHLLIQF